ncbi:MAG: hypothetical protein WKF70_14760 [Chitinophagaceae bacterium]
MSAETFQRKTKFIKREVYFYSREPKLKYVRIFSYGLDNRCMKILLGTIDSSVSDPKFTPTRTITFNYDGASLLPASLSSVRTIHPNLTTNFYFKYDNHGRKVLDSVHVKNTAGESAYKTIRYEYHKGRVHSTPVLNGFPIDHHPFDTLELLQAGNIEKQVTRLFNGGTSRTFTRRFTYDQSINPYNRLNISNSLYFENQSLGLGYSVSLETTYLGVTTNNTSSINSDGHVIRFRYVYDQDNYPVKKEIILPGEVDGYHVTYLEYQ